MLSSLQDMPDEATVWVFIATRPVTAEESRQMASMTTEWLEEWSSFYPTCPVSCCEPMFGGQVLIWAIDDRSRVPDESQAGVTGTELDPLYRRLEAFGHEAKPPFRIYPNLALVVHGEIVPMDLEWRSRWEVLLLAGNKTEQTLVLSTCSIGEWRAGKLIRPLDDHRDLLLALLQRRRSL